MMTACHWQVKKRICKVLVCLNTVHEKCCENNYCDLSSLLLHVLNLKFIRELLIRKSESIYFFSTVDSFILLVLFVLHLNNFTFSKQQIDLKTESIFMEHRHPICWFPLWTSVFIKMCYLLTLTSNSLIQNSMTSKCVILIEYK